MGIRSAKLNPGDRIGKFEIIEEIGRGGMAVVYKARQTDLGRIVAFKVINSEDPRTDAEYLQRFQEEARNMASLSHPNIVQVYEVGEEDNLNYIAMEYIEGES